MDLHDITRGNILECVLAAGAHLGHAAHSHGMNRLALLAEATEMADTAGKLDPVAATIIREGINRVLHPPEDVEVEAATPPISQLSSGESQAELEKHETWWWVCPRCHSLARSGHHVGDQKHTCVRCGYTGPYGGIVEPPPIEMEKL